ncbi:transcriptional repressor [Coemansia spiralis]|uniref:Transcriptional repressor n=2 Tax=Coemansia TaxID=4863 RepID=A0A9W8FXG7_9FUNG|nr:transcriptional repressor [Coemansia spiralis]
MSVTPSPKVEIRRPSNLGLWSSMPKCSTAAEDANSVFGSTATTPTNSSFFAPSSASTAATIVSERQVRSLSVRTAKGDSVSILNDDLSHISSATSSVRSTYNLLAANKKENSSSANYRYLSVPELSHDYLPYKIQTSRSYSSVCRSSTRLISPQLTPTRLPSLSALIQAVGMVTYAEKPQPAHYLHQPQPTSHFPCLQHNQHMFSSQPSNGLQIHTPCTQQLLSTPMPCTQAVVPRTVPAKRKYVCTFTGCGKAFTTSGHLSRHFRIHTGEKNYHCLYPGCTSRFSRQDNMMQHYRTHLSPRSRRGRGARLATTAKPATAQATMGTLVTEHNSAFTGHSTDLITAASSAAESVPSSAFHPYRRTCSQHSPLIHLQWPFY